MKKLHKRIVIKPQFAIVGLIVLTIISAFIYGKHINPLFSRAASQHLSATITGDNGVVNFSPGIDNAVANFSYTQSGSYSSDSKIYDAKIVIRDMPVNKANKNLSIKLPIGMVWVDDASTDENLLSQLDTNNHNGIESVGIGRTVLNYSFPNSGERIYHILDDALSLTVNIKIKADKNVNLGYIEDAVIAQLSYDGFSERGKVDVNVPTGISQAGRFPTTSKVKYVTPGEVFSLDEDYIKYIRGSYLVGQYSTSRLINQVKVNFHVSNPNVTLSLNNSSSIYSLDASDSANGNYILYVNFASASSAYIMLPYSVNFPDNLSPGDTITIDASAETTYWQPEGAPLTIQFANQQTITYSVLETGEDVTIGWSTLNPNNAGTANDINVNSAIEEGANMEGVLGYGYINNRGSADSNSKTVHLTFDTNVLGVTALLLPCSPGGRIESVHIKTLHGIEKDVTTNLTCNNYGLSGILSYIALDIGHNDYISELTYELGVIPKATQLRQAQRNDGSRGITFIGRRLNASAPGVATIEVYDTNNRANTTGVARITSNVAKSSALYLTASGTKVVDAGETLSFSTTISNWASASSISYAYGVKTPIIYIRSEARDANGNFLPLSNIKVTNGSARGNEDITSKFGQITYEDTETARVYKLDGSVITDGSASITNQIVSTSGGLGQANLVLSFSMETGLSAPDQTHNIADMIFVQDPTVTTVSTRSARGNPYHLGTGTNNTIYPATSNYYQIRSHQSIGVENAGKHPGSDGWITWSEGSNPITIGTTDTSFVDMKSSILNNSGTDVPGPTIVYLPIPKKGQNWGSLSHNSRDFNYSTMLTGAISNPNSTYFTISYGRNVTPSDNGSELEAEEAKFTTNTSGWTTADWGNVNCIKIIGMNIPANSPSSADIYDFLYRLRVDNVSDTDENTVNTWRPIYFQQLTNSAGDVYAGWYKGSYLSVQLADGKITGKLFLDTNEDGKLDTDELALQEAGWKVDLYDRISNRIVRSTETDQNGTYNFIELATGDNNYYIIVTNKHPIGSTGTTYLFSPKGTTSTTGSYNTDNQAEGNRSSAPFNATAYISPISPATTTGEAIYNIGLIRYTTADTYSGQVVFNDNDNQYDTRPESTTVQITSDSGTDISIEIPTDGPGTWEQTLPKYNSNMDKINYSFNTPELNNYSKEETINQTDHTYNVTYTQKTATLTVNHFVKDTEIEIADSTTELLYWGQPYNTEQVETANYEYDSVSGDPNGIVSGDITVTYYYKLKTGVVITHYYIQGTETSISPDVSTEYEYTNTYTTSPLETIPEEYAYYELVSERPAGYTGTVEAPITEVTYYYQKKDPSLSSTVSISGPESLENTTSVAHYTIDYHAHVEDYSGEVTITLISKLPYEIDLSASTLDGGVYDASTKTITWKKTFDLSTYSDGGDIVEKHEFEVVYINAVPGRIALNTVESIIALSDKNNFSADSVATIIPENTAIPNTGALSSNPESSLVSNVIITRIGIACLVSIITVIFIAKKHHKKVSFTKQL